MKTAYTSTLQYSGYPLQSTDVIEAQKPYLRVVKREVHRDFLFAFVTNKNVNDPLNWDEHWFANYE